MRTHWLRTGTGYLLFGLLMAVVGCHEEPALPDSIVPYQCRIARVEITDTVSRNTTTYDYDKTGNLAKVVFLSGNYNTPAALSNTRTYSYDSDGYLIKTEDGSTSLTYQYEGNPKRIKEISGGTLKYTYAYEGDNLKTYTVKSSTAETTYTYDSGQLSEVKSTSGNTFKVQNGKIIQYIYTSGTVWINVYNRSDQLVSEDYIAPNGTDRRLYTYTYDDKITYLNTGLFLKGFKKIGKEQPGPYLNSPDQYVPINNTPPSNTVPPNNILTSNTKYYRKVGTGWGDALIDRTLLYKHAYYKNRYSLGYDRSDGQRVRYTYSNCE